MPWLFTEPISSFVFVVFVVIAVLWALVKGSDIEH